jgi:protocatechuate 3,4-dioxygenase beta subunit
MTLRSPTPAPHELTRREALRRIGIGLAVAPLAPLLACTDDGSASEAGTDSDTTDVGSGETETGSDTTTGDECGAASEWASGGTAAMTAQHCYPDPFADGVLGCALLCQTTAGPCTSDTIERRDVSEGWAGLPVRLALKLVDADSCEPIEGAVVEIWHTQRAGVYSGVTPAGAFCYGDDPEAETHLYFRGTQTTDADGRVDFDTCYPGWYPGRAIHIHFRVSLGGQSHLVSQLFFSEALSQDIFAAHPDYAEFGQPDTLNGNDGVINGESDLAPYLLDTERMPDGAMLAWKLVAIRSSLDDPQCTLGAP